MRIDLIQVYQGNLQALLRQPPCMLSSSGIDDTFANIHELADWAQQVSSAAFVLAGALAIEYQPESEKPIR